MIGGSKSIFPTGGKSIDDGATVSPGLYIWKENLPGGVHRYFKMRLKAHKTLVIDFRTPEEGAYAGARIYDDNGVNKTDDTITGDSSKLKSIAWSPSTDGWVYFGVGNFYNGTPTGIDTLYCISVR
jgi:hypothetical protein